MRFWQYPKCRRRRTSKKKFSVSLEKDFMVQFIICFPLLFISQFQINLHHSYQYDFVVPLKYASIIVPIYFFPWLMFCIICARHFFLIRHILIFQLCNIDFFSLNFSFSLYFLSSFLIFFPKKWVTFEVFAEVVVEIRSNGIHTGFS